MEKTFITFINTRCKCKDPCIRYYYLDNVARYMRHVNSKCKGSHRVFRIRHLFLTPQQHQDLEFLVPLACFDNTVSQPSWTKSFNCPLAFSWLAVPVKKNTWRHLGAEPLLVSLALFNFFFLNQVDSKTFPNVTWLPKELIPTLVLCLSACGRRKSPALQATHSRRSQWSSSAPRFIHALKNEWSCIYEWISVCIS